MDHLSFVGLNQKKHTHFLSPNSQPFANAKCELPSRLQKKRTDLEDERVAHQVGFYHLPSKKYPRL